ncbi:unnamed protein product [Staurois parvus]|uniref:Uncharacterized protein n=1 Tax=Staurois parvus TaxID=386267 RepID=A0ABN9D1X2_9NEOB|nr:unnamed protein product [Staurois parvus]
MTRDCGHSTGMTRDCRHSTGMTPSRTADTVTGKTRTADTVQRIDQETCCGHSSRDDQRTAYITVMTKETADSTGMTNT